LVQFPVVGRLLVPLVIANVGYDTR